MSAAMPTSRSIPEDSWQQARKALVFYFTHQGAANAEDLAQETLSELWRRDDYEFREAEDFLRVCYAFARLILMAEWRRQRRRETAELAHCQQPPVYSVIRLNPAEMAAYLEEVLEAGRSQLSTRDWNAIQDCVTETGESEAVANANQANQARVQLHRARRRLGRLIGWKR
jgi:DNA-directed RNA polymerase specialized sigma24 family protein